MKVTKPEWSNNIGIFNFAWDDLNIYAKVSRIISKDKTVIGELKIWRRVDKYDSIMELLRIDLLSDKARNSLAGSLKSRNSDIEWLNVLKYICFITVEEYRKGENIEYLGDEPPTMSQDYLLYPMLRENQPTTIFADGGTGKSYLTDYIAVCIYYAYPGFYLPTLNCTLIPKPCKVLMLDWESEKIDHQRRVWAIKKGLGIDDTDRFIYRRCNEPLIDDIYEIQRIISENDIKFTVIDSQVAASDGEDGKPSGARNYYKGLRSLNCTTLTVDHVPKGDGIHDTHKPFGSIFKYNLSRSQFELKKIQQEGENVIQLALFHRKNNEGLLLKPIGYQVEFVNNGENLDKVTFTGIDVPDELNSGETQDLSSRIKKILVSSVGGKMAIDTIAEVLKLSKPTVQKYLESHTNTFGHIGNMWHVLATELN